MWLEKIRSRNVSYQCFFVNKYFYSKFNWNSRLFIVRLYMKGIEWNRVYEFVESKSFLCSSIFPNKTTTNCMEFEHFYFQRFSWTFLDLIPLDYILFHRGIWSIKWITTTTKTTTTKLSYLMIPANILIYVSCWKRARRRSSNKKKEEKLNRECREFLK